jgi:hypothetical protein
MDKKSKFKKFDGSINSKFNGQQTNGSMDQISMDHTLMEQI